MDYKIILLLLVALFIGANLLCSCCRYPVFDYVAHQRPARYILRRDGGELGNHPRDVQDYIIGNPSREGLIDNKDVGTPGSIASVKKAESDKAAVISSGQPIPSVVGAATAAFGKKEGMLDMGGLPTVFQKGLEVVSGSIGGGPPPREEQIPVTTAKKEGMAVMGSDINEVQNGDIAGMWVTKANTYASEFGYGNINNTGSAYTADEPLKNGEMVIFAKNKFKPECCPAPYSSSTGCACMTPEQIKFLNTRGGNRTSDSGV